MVIQLGCDHGKSTCSNQAFIFSNTRRFWVGIEVDMKQLEKENWNEWEEEKPGWFDEYDRVGRMQLEPCHTRDVRNKKMSLCSQ